MVYVAVRVSYKKGIEARKGKIQQELSVAEEEARKALAEAYLGGESKKRELLLLAKEEIHNSRLELEREVKDRRNEIQKNERRLVQKEDQLDRKTESMEQKEEQLKGELRNVELLKEQANDVRKEQVLALERISGLTSDEAKQQLLSSFEDEIKHESALMIKEYESRTKEEADRRAKEVIAIAVQKCASDHISEAAVSVVSLPSEEMKGRIIGREGRNIRALETLTGIDFIVDDTPEAVILSGFDPIRREVARIALEKLIHDGRIHPARIEEMVEKAKSEVEAVIRQEGEEAAFEVGVHGLHQEIVKLIGKLRFRTSYGQSVLIHSIEVARLAALLAGEIGVDAVVAKRAGLLHDIGKAVDYEMEGSHVMIGGDLAKRYREGNDVINAIMSHHGDVEPTSVTSILVGAADAISASRPGARRETLQTYIKRIEKLEEIANSFPGVNRSFAIQAGREIRIIVKPEEIGDDDMILKAREIVQKIEGDLDYPGQIKVSMIRETRVIDYAK